MASTEPRVAVCPHLSSFRDVATFYAYPSADNGCGRFAPPAPLPGSYQSGFCLGARHTECPLVSPSWSGAFPQGLRAAAEREWGRPGARSRRRRALFALAAVTFLGVSAGAVWFLSGLGAPEPAVPEEEAPALPPPAQPTHTPSVTPTASATPSPSASPTPAPSDTPAPTFTATPGPELETPFGRRPTFLIHTILAGENLSSLAQAYATSVQAIQAANRLGTQPLWIGELVVIPVGTSDPAGMPGFEIVRVADPGELLSDLAARFAADPESIRGANALGEDPWLLAGRWLIVPLP